MNLKLENYLRDRTKDIKQPLITFLHYQSSLNNTNIQPLYVNLVTYYNKHVEKDKRIIRLTEENLNKLSILTAREIIEEGILKLSPVNFRHFYSRMVFTGSGNDKRPVEMLAHTENQDKMVTMAVELDEIYKEYLKEQILNTSSYDDLIDRVYGGYCQYNDIVHHTDETDTKRIIKEYAHKQILTELFFSDTFKNVYANMNALKRFNNNFQENNLHNIDRKYQVLEEVFYKNIRDLDFNSTMRDVRASFYNLMTTHIKLQETLYDAFRQAKLIASKSYVDACTDFTKFPCEIINGVEVYKVNKANYSTLVSVTDIPRKDIDYNFFKKSKRSDIISCSFVDKDNLITFKDLRRHFAVIYDEFPAKQLEMISENDSYTNYEYGDLKLSRYQYSFLRPDQITQMSGFKQEYNECTIINPNMRKMIQKHPDIAGRFKEIRPSYVFCLGSSKDKEPNITPNEWDFARKMGIPIVYVENDNYQYHGETLPQYGTEYDQTL